MRVHYTGDVANQSGWFLVERGDIDDPNSRIVLVEVVEEAEGPRFFTVLRRHIGDRQFGHCNPRFVTEEAHDAYFARRAQGVLK